MKARISFAIILISMLLTQSLHGLNWQGTGSGMNSTVIMEIWDGLENKLGTAFNSGTKVGRNAFVKDISDRLNARWDPAWNVIFYYRSSHDDAILYGYSFRNQWMWYNNVPYNSNGYTYQVALLIWKDYNCQDWKFIGDGATETSSFSTAQKAAIKAEINKMTEDKINNDIWVTAFTMMDNIGKDSLFSSGGYSVIMTQYGSGYIFGRVCRVGDGFYNSWKQLPGPIISSSNKGQFYLFQTR